MIRAGAALPSFNQKSAVDSLFLITLPSWSAEVGCGAQGSCPWCTTPVKCSPLECGEELWLWWDGQYCDYVRVITLQHNSLDGKFPAGLEDAIPMYSTDARKCVWPTPKWVWNKTFSLPWDLGPNWLLMTALDSWGQELRWGLSRRLTYGTVRS